MTQYGWGIAAETGYRPLSYWTAGRRDHEVEIARITIGVVLPDAISICATWLGGRIAYGVVDEFLGFPAFELTPAVTRAPLTFAQLMRLIESAQRRGLPERGLIAPFLEWHSECGADLWEVADSVRAESRFYPGLSGYCAREARRWLESRSGSLTPAGAR